MKQWLFITAILSSNIGMAAWRYNKTDGIYAFGLSFPFMALVALVIEYWLEMSHNKDMRQQRYEFILKLHTPPQEQKAYPELPPDEPKTPVYFPRNDGFVQREKVDYTEFARLARVIKSVSYHIRARDLLSDYASVRREFGKIEGVTTEKNGVMDLTDYGIRLVNDLSALSPTEAMNPPLHITRRVTRAQHTQENTYGEVV